MRDGDHLVAKITGGDLLATAGALGPNEGLEAQFIPTSATQFVL